MPGVPTTDHDRHVTDLPGASILLDLFVTSQHLGTLLTKAFDGIDITPAQYAVYSAIGTRSITPTAIGETLGVRAPTLSGYLATMEQRGDLLRVPSATDRRSVTVSLTDAGRTRLEQARASFTAALHATHRQVGEDSDVEAARANLARLDRAIRAATAEL